LFLLPSLPIALLVPPKVGRWIGLPGFWAVCAVLAAAGVGSFARAILEATNGDHRPRHRIGLAALNVVLGTLYLSGGCGGFWAFTTRALRGNG
jgi:hypothetical protein